MNSLTASEQRIFSNGMVCSMEGLNNIKVDYEKLAAMSGLKNAAVASVLFNKARRRLISIQNGDNPSPVKKAAGPEKVTKRTTARKNTKAKAKAVDEEGVAPYPETPVDSTEADDTPVKKRGGGRRAATNAKKIKSEEDTNTMNEPIDLINEGIKIEGGAGYENMLGDFGEGIIDATVYGAAEPSSQVVEEEDSASAKEEDDEY